MRRGVGFLGPALAAGLAVWLLSAVPAMAQAGGSLVIVSTGATLVVGTQGVPTGTVVRFQVTVDEVTLPSTYAVRAGGQARVGLPRLPSGGHHVEVSAVDPSSVAGVGADFRTSSSFGVVAIILGLVFVGLILFYRRRVLEPFTRRYDPSTEGTNGEDRPKT